MASRTQPRNDAAIPDAIRQLDEMLAGARAERAEGRLRAAGTLAVSGAVRASDLICDSELGYHSTASNHRAAVDLLATVPNSDTLVEDLEVCISRKRDLNYSVETFTERDVIEVIDAAERLGDTAKERLKKHGLSP